MTHLQIHYFITLAKIGNITAAAKFLSISQPVISRQIKALEQELNATLFVRLHTGVMLTDAGQLYYDFFLRYINEFNRVSQKAANLTHGATPIRVGVLEYSIIPPMRAAMRTLKYKYPGIEMILDRQPVPRGIEPLLSGETDILFTFSDMVAASGEISFRPIIPTYDCLILPAGETQYSDCERCLESFQDNVRTIYVSHHNTLGEMPLSHPYHRAQKLPGLKDCKFVFLQNNGSVLEQVKSGWGVGFQNSSALMNSEEDYQIFALERSSDMVIAWKTAAERPAIHHIIEEFAALPWESYVPKDVLRAIQVCKQTE